VYGERAIRQMTKDKEVRLDNIIVV